MKIFILVDDYESWFVPYGERLKKKLIDQNHEVHLIHRPSKEYSGQLCFMLSCVHIVDQEFITQFNHCIVVHASDLPRGKGFSPLQWQILEGSNEIVLTLFEASSQADAGPFYFKDTLVFAGYELLPDLRDEMAKKIVEMCVTYTTQSNYLIPEIQSGPETNYRRRAKKDDEIDISKSIEEQWNHFRIADNMRHPLWFEHMGHRYILRIEREQ